MRAIVVALIVICAYLAGGSIAQPFIDGDLFWQRALGEQILATGHIPTVLGHDVFSAPGVPWLPQEWISSILVAFAFRANTIWLLAVLTGITFFATLWISAVRAKRWNASQNGVLLALLLGVICLVPGFVLRSQIWVWPLFAALLLSLDYDDARVWLSLPIVVVWANLHASAVLAIPIVWLDTGVYALRRIVPQLGVIEGGALRTRCILSVAVVIAAMCTPFGWGLLKYATETHPSFQYIYEWFPISSLDFQIVAGFIPLVGLCLYCAWRLWRIHPRDVVLSIALAVYAVMHQRNIGLFTISAMPLAAVVIGKGAQWSRWFEGARGTLIAVVICVVAGPVAAWLGYGVSASQPPLFTPPQASIAALRTQPGEHRLLCTTYSWCSTFLGDPSVRVFLDGRADPYPDDVWKAFLTIIRVEPGWQDALSHYDVNTVLAKRQGLLAHDLGISSQWREIPDSDPCCRLFVR